MMSIELLYSRQVIRTTSLNPAVNQRSFGAIENDEILSILSQVQSKHPVGNAVLDAQIALDEGAKRLLIKSLACSLVDVDTNIALSLSKAAVREVCDSSVCPRCKGSGLFVKPGEGLVDCSRCHGVGNFIPSERALHKAVIGNLPKELQFSRSTFKRKWYDIYMGLVDRLHSEAGEAAHYAKGILRAIDLEGCLIR